jgi:hypothetical protein
MDLRRVYWAALCIAAFIYQNSASAEIRYSTGPISEGLVDVNDDASPDFRFGTLVNAFAPDPWLSLDGGVTYTFSVSGVAPFHPDYVNPNGVLVDGSHPLQLQGGESIGPDIADGLSWRHDFRSLLLSFRMGDHGQSFGPWGLSPAGLLGLRLQSGVDNYYGWIRVHGDDIIDWAYESTPNTPIIAGAVPEPAAWLLIVAAAAIMAGWKLRRRVLPLLLCVFIQVAANGEIIHRTAVRPGSFEPFDLDENGQLDFRFDVKTAVTEPDHLSIFFAIEQIGGAHNGVLADSDTVPALSPGFVVGPDSLGLSWDDEFVERKIPDVSPAGSLLGHPPAPPTQFVGIRLRADDGWHYGWARLAQSYWAPFDRDHPNWPEDTGSVPYFALPHIDTYNPGLIDWAYESTPDAPIIAGAVPEPGGIALVFTAIVFSCVLIGRRFLARQRGLRLSQPRSSAGRQQFRLPFVAFYGSFLIPFHFFERATSCIVFSFGCCFWWSFIFPRSRCAPSGWRLCGLARAATAARGIGTRRRTGIWALCPTTVLTPTATVCRISSKCGSTVCRQ